MALTMAQSHLKNVFSSDRRPQGSEIGEVPIVKEPTKIQHEFTIKIIVLYV